MTMFKPATRSKIWLRATLDGPSGSGKTYTALRLATVLSQATGRRIAAVDTENGSMRKYQGEKPDGVPFTFDVVELTNHSPSTYATVIRQAEAEGYGVLVVDSLSHAWTGTDGALDQVGKKTGNSYTAWKDVTPQHRDMIEAILNSGLHVITTMRVKTDFVLEEDARGKKVPRKIGLAPVQREGMEYEFDLVADIDWEHLLKVSKSRCSPMQDAICHKPGPLFWRPLLDWLNLPFPDLDTELPAGPPAASSDPLPGAIPMANVATQQQAEEIVRLCQSLEIPREKIQQLIGTFKKADGQPCQRISEMQFVQAEQMLTRLAVALQQKLVKKDAEAEVPFYSS